MRSEQWGWALPSLLKYSWAKQSLRRLFEVNTAGRGNVGDIEIVVDALELGAEARLSTDSFGLGNAGDIRIDAQREVRLQQGELLSEIATEAQG